VSTGPTVVRNAGPDDLDGVLALYEAGSDRLSGMSSIRPDRDFLAARLERSEAAFASRATTPGDRDYLFVLTDLDSGTIVGTSAIFAAVGLGEAFYSYRIGTTVHASRELGVYKRLQTLHLSNDYTGATEIASLYVHEDWLGGGNGRLASLSRMLYMAEHPEAFDQRVIAEMRGFQRADGSAPFWEGLGRRFFGIPFPEADRRAALGAKEFIAELMPRHPIYVQFLPPDAREAIGQVHPSTEPARRLLEGEGFSHQGYVDIFDGGPTLEARLDDLRPVRESLVVDTVVTEGLPEADPVIVATRDAESFRAALLTHYVIDDHDTLEAPAILYEVLGVEPGTAVRTTPARPGRAVL
jgi:arginine N-succinyltransferase